MNVEKLMDFSSFEEILNKAVDEGKISAWNIKSYILKKNNIYVEENSKIESILKSKRHEFIFTIYRDFEETIGESTFTLNESNLEKFEEELEDAIFISSTSQSKKYSLPSKDDLIVKDDHIDYDIFYNSKYWSGFDEYDFENFLSEKLNSLNELVSGSCTDSIGLRVNYSEFFNSIATSFIQSSTGIFKNYKKNSSYFEFVITAKNLVSGEEKEHIVYEDINDIFSFDWVKFFSKHIQFAKDTLIAEKSEDFTGKVILSDFAGYDFFIPSPSPNPLVSFSSARLKFMKVSNYEIGKNVVESKMDKLTIYSNALLEGNSASSPYDYFGISGRRICLIGDSVFKNYLASKQYADYLDVEPSGPAGVIEVEGGSKSSLELYNDSDEMIEIVSFAWFNPDTASGDFSSEIRLGYRIKDGLKVPFKGGLFVGNVFKVVEEVELSSDTINIPKYKGPEMVKFWKGKIVGM